MDPDHLRRGRPDPRRRRLGDGRAGLSGARLAQRCGRRHRVRLCGDGAESVGQAAFR